MPWFKVDDKLHDHRKTRQAKKAAMGVWVLAGSWSADNLTDGFIPEDVALRWGTRHDFAALVSAGLWTDATRESERGWQFVNWTEFQPTKADVERERAKKAEAGRIGGKASGRSRREASAQAGASPIVEPPNPSPNPSGSNEPEADKSAKARSRATALPGDFRPADNHVQLAEQMGVDLQREWAKFTDYARANGKTYKDWSAALNNWIRKAAEYGGRPAPLTVVTDPSLLPPVEESWMRRRR